MPRFAIKLGAILLFCLPAFASAAPPADSSAQAVLKLEHTWVRAISEHDSAFVERLLADNFIDMSWQGRLRSKADMLENLKRPKPATQVLSDLKVRVFGETAIVTGLNTMTGRDNAWQARLRFTDVFVGHADQWHAVSSQETLIGKS